MGMTARIGAVLAVTALAGCGLGQTRLNPFNWFGSDREERIEVARVATARPVVQQVVSLEVAQTRSGAIISAVGLPPTQGFWEADLVRVPTDDPSVLLLDFRILPPITPEPVGTQPSREVLAGTTYSTQDLAGIRTIVVQGEVNRRSVSR
ncbi:MAG: hypothetical protein WBA02_13250 [Jannaschia helgolandensis]|uniref:Lipoprotein n=1 Tax=Jannaschia helgolandensis TaxID=188906 RepID=A0A1H7PHV2_9RHOB|nr:hypothetical protein [Jannaschia helgolandensis]SEL34865.1 hypothetical protein SAMN04488526_2534 [Jannaschia helgolandensis]